MDAKVRDVMTPDPIGVDYHQSIGEAARTMRDWGVGAVLVVHDQSLYGLITDHDLVVRAVAEAKGADEPVGPLSSGGLIGVDVDADAGEAARLMREHAVRRLPVIEDGQVAGMVSLGDLAMQDDPARGGAHHGGGDHGRRGHGAALASGQDPVSRRRDYQGGPGQVLR